MTHMVPSRRHAQSWLRRTALLALCIIPALSFTERTNAKSALPARTLSIQAGSTDEIAGANASVGASSATLRGPESRLQLVVSLTDGQKISDVTTLVHYTADPANIIRVDSAGAVLPMADGVATVSATTTDDSGAKLTASAQITVTGLADPTPINFPNQVIPIFTKLGCNSGACHGKSGGQNGFRLSLLGFEPDKDYRYLVEDSHGRRVFPAAPDQSLLLLKSTNVLAHGGGERMKRDSRDYRLVARWIREGMPFGKPTDPMLANISVFPPVRRLPGDAKQQLLVVAHYSDGSSEDVTNVAQYDPNDKDMSEASPSGRVGLMGRPGDIAVMVRYQGQVCVFRATVPVGAPVQDLPKPQSLIDELAFAKFRDLGLPPSERCDDTTFIRRVTLDVTGRLPTAAESRAFLASSEPGKRDAWIDRLVASPGYADWFAAKWSSILRNKREKDTYQRGNYLFYNWIHTSLESNKRYDQFVRELLTATGDETVTPAVNWYRQVKEPTDEVENTAQLFLGVRIGCAKCHHHPFERWSQQDYYGMTAFFSRVGRKDGDGPDEFRVYHKRGLATGRNPMGGPELKPTGLGAAPMDVPTDQDPRAALATWMTSRDNPFFAKALVNRYWKHFFGRGIVDAEDDMRATNPPTNPELLDGLTAHFAAGGFDLKDLVRMICKSELYQRSSEPNEFNERDRQSFSHFYPRRLPAEVLLDAVDQLGETRSNFTGMPAGGRAVQLPDMNGVDSYFLQVFGRPAGGSACECERAGDTNLAQTLLLLNSNEMFEKVTGGVAPKLATPTDGRSDEQQITQLYYAAFSRAPSARELSRAIIYLNTPIIDSPAGKSDTAKPNRRAAYEDLLWALMNTKEFLFNH